MHYELEGARADRQATREERALLLQMLQDMQHRYDRLLEAPRSTPVSASPGPGAPADTHVPRGDMRRRIVALFQEHPEVLIPVQTRRLLGRRRRTVHAMLMNTRPHPGADAPAARPRQGPGEHHEGDGAGWAVATGRDGSVCALTTLGAECCQTLVEGQESYPEDR
jgi:hypothetical protein